MRPVRGALPCAHAVHRPGEPYHDEAGQVIELTLTTLTRLRILDALTGMELRTPCDE
jgi:hypothetical protein